MNSKPFLFLFLCIVFVTNSFSQKQKTKQISTFLQPYADSQTFSGNILVAKKGKIIFQKSYGKANHNWNISNENNTKFVIGSISKSFTATLITKLIQEGKLNLNDPISTFFPSCPEEFQDVTIHHLMSNTSGIPNYFMLDGWIKGEFRKYISYEDFLKLIFEFELIFPAGEGYHYSNSNYFLLGLIIEKITNLTYENALQKYILQPLNMNQTGVFANSKVLKNLASGYRFKENGGYRNQMYMNFDLFKAGGNLYATTEDLLKLDQALYSNKLLNENSKKILFNPKYRNGWNVSKIKINEKEYQNCNYDGQMEGYSSIIYRFTDENITIILLSNNGISYATKNHIVQNIASILFDSYQKEKEPYSLVLNKAIFDGNLKEAIANYSKVKNNYSINTDLIHDLAKQMDWSDLPEISEEIYKFNVKLFPDKIETTFNLAEFYKQRGKIKKAIPLYKEVLKEYPNNSYLKNIINQEY
ncbi:serine hydrolase domain-containing protein [Aureivirga marina]|uniref:serine hydrolase domain-containing protein n=1 Tax=Aureivirga marina TaxID=1182451 RepID=UPI0018C97CBB|nr:serine hydrolase domain-containing protein [Aureivirga marina]